MGVRHVSRWHVPVLVDAAARAGARWVDVGEVQGGGWGSCNRRTEAYTIQTYHPCRATARVPHMRPTCTAQSRLPGRRTCRRPPSCAGSRWPCPAPGLQGGRGTHTHTRVHFVFTRRTFNTAVTEVVWLIESPPGCAHSQHALRTHSTPAGQPGQGRPRQHGGRAPTPVWHSAVHRSRPAGSPALSASPASRSRRCWCRRILISEGLGNFGAPPKPPRVASNLEERLSTAASIAADCSAVASESGVACRGGGRCVWCVCAFVCGGGGGGARGP